MLRILRQLLLFGPTILVGAVNLGHPIVQPPMYAAILPHLQWWMTLHLLNLFLFPLMGVSAYLLVADEQNVAATVSKMAILVYVLLYAAFDALMGIGTGTLVQHASHLPSEQLAVVSPAIDAFWASPTLYAIAAGGSIAWVIAMLAAVVAFTSPDRRLLVAGAVVVVFIAGGWARSNLFFAPDGVTITRAWWLVTVSLGVVMLTLCKPRIVGVLLTLAGALFGAQHLPPTGPLGAACLLASSLYMEFVLRKQNRFVPAPLD
jgi:hypothetical protein